MDLTVGEELGVGVGVGVGAKVRGVCVGGGVGGGGTTFLANLWIYNVLLLFVVSSLSFCFQVDSAA
jgi:hypothetical protein